MSTDDISAPPTAQTRAALALARLYFDTQSGIAGSIHDGFVQYIVGAKMWLESIEDEPLTDEGKIAVKTVLGALSDGVADARQLIRQLRHETVAVDNLAQALTENVIRYRSSVNHEIELAIEGDLTGIVEDLQIVVRGVIHDLINRLVEASAAIIAISVKRRGGQLEVRLITKEPTDPRRTLDSLHILMRAIGGELSISVKPPGSAFLTKFPIP